MPSDDIVTRLRVLTKTLLLGDFKGLAETTESAADEIERLRSVVEAWLKYSQRAERDIETLRAERAAAIKQRDEARDYSIALQRAIEHHRRGLAVPPAIAANCPHHAQMLNEHLASKEGGGA